MRDAKSGTESELDSKAAAAEDKVKEGAEGGEEEAKDRYEQLRRDVQALKEGTWTDGKKVKEKVSDYEGKLKDAAGKIKEEGRRLTNGGGSGSPRRASPGKEQPEGEQPQKNGSAEVEGNRDAGGEEGKTVAPEEEESSGGGGGDAAEAKQEDDTDAMGKSGIDVPADESGESTESRDSTAGGGAEQTSEKNTEATAKEGT